MKFYKRQNHRNRSLVIWSQGRRKVTARGTRELWGITKMSYSLIEMAIIQL